MNVKKRDLSFLDIPLGVYIPLAYECETISSDQMPLRHVLKRFTISVYSCLARFRDTRAKSISSVSLDVFELHPTTHKELRAYTLFREPSCPFPVNSRDLTYFVDEVGRAHVNVIKDL